MRLPTCAGKAKCLVVCGTHRENTFAAGNIKQFEASKAALVLVYKGHACLQPGNIQCLSGQRISHRHTVKGSKSQVFGKQKKKVLFPKGKAYFKDFVVFVVLGFFFPSSRYTLSWLL